MKSIFLNGREVMYDIVFKKNKNTYFYFKDSNYIKINASTYQKEQDIINHMINNAETFIQKLDRVSLRKPKKDETKYRLFGTTYHKVFSDEVNEIVFKDNQIIIPVNEVDQLKKFEKELVLKELQELHHKYKHNGYIDLSNVTINTRYTKTRFGSCNASKRRLNFNTNLVHYDKVYLEYVFLHEICHLTHQNHSVNFYLLLAKLCPNYKQLRKELKSIYNG